MGGKTFFFYRYRLKHTISFILTRCEGDPHGVVSYLIVVAVTGMIHLKKGELPTVFGVELEHIL